MSGFNFSEFQNQFYSVNPSTQSVGQLSRSTSSSTFSRVYHCRQFTRSGGGSSLNDSLDSSSDASLVAIDNPHPVLHHPSEGNGNSTTNFVELNPSSSIEWEIVAASSSSKCTAAATSSNYDDENKENEKEFLTRKASSASSRVLCSASNIEKEISSTIMPSQTSCSSSTEEVACQQTPESSSPYRSLSTPSLNLHPHHILRSRPAFWLAKLATFLFVFVLSIYQRVGPSPSFRNRFKIVVWLEWIVVKWCYFWWVFWIHWIAKKLVFSRLIKTRLLWGPIPPVLMFVDRKIFRSAFSYYVTVALSEIHDVVTHIEVHVGAKATEVFARSSTAS